jgi:hypothetical protein
MLVSAYEYTRFYNPENQHHLLHRYGNPLFCAKSLCVCSRFPCNCIAQTGQAGLCPSMTEERNYCSKVDDFEKIKVILKKTSLITTLFNLFLWTKYIFSYSTHGSLRIILDCAGSNMSRETNCGSLLLIFDILNKEFLFQINLLLQLFRLTAERSMKFWSFVLNTSERVLRDTVAKTFISSNRETFRVPWCYFSHWPLRIS